MAEEKSRVKLNKKHGGKEFNSYFRFIGQVKQYRKFVDGQMIPQPFYSEGTTFTTGKPKKSVVFDLFTAKNNQLKIELNGYIKPNAYITSSTDNNSIPIKWEDRHDKTKYLNETYHLMTQEWDLAEEIGGIIHEGMWVEVKGKYEFDSWVSDGKEKFATKRIITSFTPIENGYEVNIGKEKFNYVCDFESPDFREANYFNMQIGILSTYQDEQTRKTNVNGVYLSYGKERSTVKDAKLFVSYKEAAEGKVALADAFASLNRLDFIEVSGIDHNRVDYVYVDDTKVSEDDPFADVEETTVRKQKPVITGETRGLEITSTVKGSYLKGVLTEAEIEKQGVGVQTTDPFADVSDGNPFASIDGGEDLPFPL